MSDNMTAASDEPPSGGSPFAFHGRRVLLALGLAAFTYLLFPTAPAPALPPYEVGSVAAGNVIAPFAFRVPKDSTELAREQDAAIHLVPPVFRLETAVADSVGAALSAFRRAVDSAAVTRDRAAAIQRAASRYGVALTSAEARYLTNDRRRATLLVTIQRVFDRWLGGGVAASGALDRVRGVIVLRHGADERMPTDSVLTFAMLLNRARLVEPDPSSNVGEGLYTRLLTTFFRPTIIADAAATDRERARARDAVPTSKYDVRAGEKLVGANEVLGRDEFEKLEALRAEVARRSAQRGAGTRVLGAILFNFLVIGLLGITLVKFRPQVYANYRALTTFAAIAALVVGGGAAVASFPSLRPELIPIALGAVLFSAVFDPRISMIASMVLATLIGGQAVFRGTNALFINLVGGAVAAFSVRAIRRRAQSYRWIVWIAAAYTVTALATGLTLDLPRDAIVTSVGYGLLNAVASVLVALLLLPAAEALTGVETDLTLLEWSDLNRPLLQQLSLSAPGTHAHTIAVANLAEAACRAIGANALLARVGAYYHDIGKIAQPQYFVENQIRGRNPHDALQPDQSASIIRDHVSAGLAMAEKHRLPRALRDFITQHHGTGAISYFLDKAKQGSAGGEPDPAHYAYPGPLPQTAETAVVMLADGVEAAVRVLADPTAARIRDVVDHIVRQRMDQGQLVDAPLTLRQIETVKSEFTRVLSGMYHSRIDYPASSGGVSARFASA